MMTKESEKTLKVAKNVEETAIRGSDVSYRPNSTKGSESEVSETQKEKKSGNNKKQQKEQKGQESSLPTTTRSSQGTPQGLPISPAPSSPLSKNNMSPTGPSVQSHSSQHSQTLNGHQEETTNGNTGGRLNKCCLCWCCCCRCPCGSLKNNQDNRTKTPNKDSDSSDLNCDSDTTPSLEEVRSWGESFDKLMKHPAGRKIFREFLKCEYSEENILFWLACEDLKKESKPELIEEKARLIYEDYISILSPKEVSLDSRVREIVNQNMVDPNPHTFDEAQVQIYTLMHRDSYPRFVNSVMFKKLAQLNITHRGSAVSTTGLSNPASRKESLAA